MKINVGKYDRALRIIVGLGILSLTLVGPHSPWGYLGIIPILTGAFRFCPAYLPFKMNTCKFDK